MSRFKYVPLYQGGGFIPDVYASPTSASMVNNYGPLVQVASQPVDSGVSSYLQTSALGNQREEMRLKRDQFNKQIDHDNLKIMIGMIDSLDKEGDYGTTGVKGVSKNGVPISGNIQTDAQFRALQQAKAERNTVVNKAMEALMDASTKGDTNALKNIYIQAKEAVNNSPMSRDAYKATNQAATYEETQKMNRAMIEKAPGNYDPTALAAADKEFRSSDLDYDPGKLNVENFRSVQSLANDFMKEFPQQSPEVIPFGKTPDGAPLYDAIMKNTTTGDGVSMREYLKKNSDNTLNYRFQDMLDRGLIDLHGRTLDQAREDYKNEEINHVVETYKKGKKEFVQAQDNEITKAAIETKKALDLESFKEDGKTKQLQDKQKEIKDGINYYEPFNQDPKHQKEDGEFSGFVGGVGTMSEAVYSPARFKSDFLTSKVVADLVDKDFKTNYRIANGNYQTLLPNGEWSNITKKAYESVQHNAEARAEDFKFFQKDNQAAVDFAIKKLGISKDSVDENGNLIPEKQYTEYLAGNDAQGAPYGVSAGQVYRVPTNISGKFEEAKNEYLKSKYKSYQENTYKVIPADGDDFTKSVNDQLQRDPIEYLKSFELRNKDFELMSGVQDNQLGKIKWAKLDHIEYDSISNRWYTDIVYSDTAPKEGAIPENPKHVKVYDPQHSTQWTQKLTGSDSAQGTIDLINHKFKFNNEIATFAPNEFGPGEITITRDKNNRAMYNVDQRQSDGTLLRLTQAPMNLLTLAGKLNAVQKGYNYSSEKYVKNNESFYNQVVGDIADADAIFMDIESSGGANVGSPTTKEGYKLSSAKGALQWTKLWDPKIDSFLDEESNRKDLAVNVLQGMTYKQRRDYFFSKEGAALNSKFFFKVAAPEYKYQLNDILSTANSKGSGPIQVGDVTLGVGKQTPKEMAAWTYMMHHLGYPNVKELVNNGGITKGLIDLVRPQVEHSSYMRKIFNKANGLPDDNLSFTDEQISKGKIAEVGLLVNKILNNPKYNSINLADD